jgi:hypothetical protein
MRGFAKTLASIDGPLLGRVGHFKNFNTLMHPNE